MKTTGFRSVVLYLLLFAFLGGIGWFLVNFTINGSRWAMQPYNGHIYAGDSSVKLGDIKDRNGNLLASTQDGTRVYSEDETTRRAMLHTVGDTDGYISTSVQYTMRSRLAGYNFITGINNTFLNSFNNNISLTVDQNACVEAYNALGENDGAVIVYNYKNGEILCKVSKPTFDPANVPEDLETNDGYKGVYLDGTLAGSFTPGSIFKIVTAAAAMEKWPQDWSTRTYDCEGSVELGGDRINCLGTHGTIALSEALGSSCNVYFAMLANDIGAASLQKKAEEMGFNKQFNFGTVEISKSEIDLSAANTNQLGWAGVGQYTLLANPYHMMILMGAIANGGEYVEPKITGGTNIFGELTKGESRMLVTPDEAGQLKALLRADVEDYYGDYLFPESMKVCAKTGTGEVGEGKKPNCWMVGFSESEETPYAFAVLVEEGIGGIESAGNVASRVMNALAGAI